MKPSCRILMIEKHPVFAKLVELILEMQTQIKIDILVVRNVETGLTVLPTGLFDLMLIDASLSNGKGAAFWESVSMQSGMTDVIAVGSQNDFEEMVLALENGASECLFRNLVCQSVLLSLVRRTIGGEEDTDPTLTEPSLFPNFDFESDETGQVDRYLSRLMSEQTTKQGVA